MPSIPALPDLPADHISHDTSALRYEDVAQDGRVMLMALPHSLGLVWRGPLAADPASDALTAAGIIPILSRMIIVGTDSPASVRSPFQFTGRYQTAHSLGADGEVDRLLLLMWSDGQAPVDRTYGPPPPGAGQLASVGQVFAEHVFTRPFAPPGQRKVLRFELDDRPAVPEARYAWQPATALLDLPAGAVPLDDALRPDPVTLCMGLMHTDSNQHVNSLVYPTLFEEAALRRLDELGKGSQVLARALEVVYRKPLFAGDRCRLMLRAYQDARGLGVVGAFVADGEGPADLGRAHAYLHMRLS